MSFGRLKELGLEAQINQLVSITAAKNHQPVMESVAARPLREMMRQASMSGIAIRAVSGFRSIERQTLIWERKFEAASSSGLNAKEAVQEVMEYSAPPGWSRHHWGTDVDLVAGPLIEAPRLEPQDWEPGGPSFDAHKWLESRAADFGFFKPYDEFRGGYLAEPWHWSFLPTSLALIQRMAEIDWAELFARADFLGSDELAEQADELFPRFVWSINERLRV